MTPIFIARLHQIEITENLGSGDKISNSLKITNDRTQIEKLIPHMLRPSIGSMELAYLLDGAPVIFSAQEIPKDVSPRNYLISRLYEVQLFLMTSWIFKDNSINVENGFLFYSKNGALTADSNSIAHHYSTADGKVEPISITRNELRAIRESHRKILPTIDPTYELPRSSLTTEHPRYARASYFINGARGTMDIAIKVAHYCTAFETLFSHSTTELSHQMAERISFYLFNSAEDRLKNYRKIKSAYSLRSKVVHGSTLQDKKLAEATETSIYCDELARMTFSRIHTAGAENTVFSLNGDEFDEAMLKMIFGGAA